MPRRTEGVYRRETKKATVWDVTWTANGKKYFKRNAGRTSKVAAEYRRRAMIDADEGRHVAPSKETFGAHLERWVASHHDTAKRYVRLHVVPALGKIPLQRLTAEDIEPHYAFLRDGEGMSPNTIRLIHAFISQALRSAEERGRVRVNVARHVRPPKRAQATTPEPWTAEELKKFLVIAKADRLHSLWRFAVTTGARRGEILGLRWSDIRLSANMVEIRGTKTNASRRTIDLDDETVAVLRSWKRVQAEEFIAFGAGRPETVFTHESGRVTSPKDIYVGFMALRERAELRHVRFHDLRHAHATHLLRQGVPVHVVSKRLGHANPNITLSVYAHVVSQQQAEAAANFAAMFE